MSQTFTAGGNTTVSMGSEGYFSASAIGTAGSFTLDGAAATTGQTTIQGLLPVAESRFPWELVREPSLIVSGATGGNFTLDATQLLAVIDVTNCYCFRQSYVVSVGTNGDFSAGVRRLIGAFTVDAAAANSQEPLL